VQAPSSTVVLKKKSRDYGHLSRRIIVAALAASRQARPASVPLSSRDTTVGVILGLHFGNHCYGESVMSHISKPGCYYHDIRLRKIPFAELFSLEIPFAEPCRDLKLFIYFDSAMAAHRHCDNTCRGSDEPEGLEHELEPAGGPGPP
jgi:hypothetical protein